MKEDSAKAIYREYWSALRKHLQQENPPFRLVEPLLADRYKLAIGRTGFKLEAVGNSKPKEKWIRVQIALVGPKAAPLFANLQRHSEEIQKQIVDRIEWAKPHEVPFARITSSDCDVLDKKDWPRQHKWLADRLIRYHKVFSPIIQSLPR